MIVQTIGLGMFFPSRSILLRQGAPLLGDDRIDSLILIWRAHKYAVWQRVEGQHHGEAFGRKGPHAKGGPGDAAAAH
jgi:hypothetical protein